MEFIELDKNKIEDIKKMSFLVSSIIKEYYDPLLGSIQNDYMINKFQSFEAISDQLNHNYHYCFINLDNQDIGFLAYFYKIDCLYLSKLYLVKEFRGKGYARIILDFLVDICIKSNLKGIELNVNKYNKTRFIYEKLGFVKIKDEVNDIGSGFVMDDYVYYYEIKE